MLVAVAVDLALGDPPNRLHPVAAMGAALSAGRRYLCVGGRLRLLVAGGLLTLALAAASATAFWGIGLAAARTGVVGVALEGAALSLLLSARGLVVAAHGVADALAAGNLAGARAAVGWHLVSRPTVDLRPGQVASATIESVAENLTDALLAPLCCFLVFGLPGAAAYRAINTADAMIGYREGALEHFGKIAARLDDALNFVPARVAALVIVLATLVVREDGSGAWRMLVRDRGRTASPNAGWTMAAMAGALGVTLEKPGAYRLGRGRTPDAPDIRRATRLVAVAAVLAIAGISVAAFMLRDFR